MTERFLGIFPHACRLITFIVVGVMRGLDEAGSDQPERLFSFIVHLERLRRGCYQQALAQRLIEQLRTADLSTGTISTEVKAAYDDLKASRRAGKMTTPSLAVPSGDRSRLRQHCDCGRELQL